MDVFLKKIIDFFFFFFYFNKYGKFLLLLIKWIIYIYIYKIRENNINLHILWNYVSDYSDSYGLGILYTVFGCCELTFRFRVFLSLWCNKSSDSVN